MGYDKETRRFGNTLDNDRYMSDEQRARQQAYEEYLSLRENRAPRGNYVKNDDLYGSYFSNGRREDKSRDELREEYMRVRRGRSIDNTPYGASEMRRRSKSLARVVSIELTRNCSKKSHQDQERREKKRLPGKRTKERRKVVG